ncbi:hypothetical protein QWZ18_25050, partial [Methylobacterium longum]|nr:hypothetical protein [Methylobacterium longum]
MNPSSSFGFGEPLPQLIWPDWQRLDCLEARGGAQVSLAKAIFNQYKRRNNGSLTFAIGLITGAETVPLEPETSVPAGVLTAHRGIGLSEEAEHAAGQLVEQVSGAAETVADAVLPPAPFVARGLRLDW